MWTDQVHIRLFDYHRQHLHKYMRKCLLKKPILILPNWGLLITESTDVEQIVVNQYFWEWGNNIIFLLFSWDVVVTNMENAMFSEQIIFDKFSISDLLTFNESRL